MRVFQYNEYDPDLSARTIIQVTEEDILNEYWEYWYNRMINKYGRGHPLITKEVCIADRVAVHWAWEV